MAMAAAALAGLAWRGALRGARSGVGLSFPNGRSRPAVAAALRLLGSDSALEHILGIAKEDTACPVGQHPPPLSAFKAEQDNLLQQRPDQPDNPKTLRIAIIGAPNAGKSTLSNQLLGRKVLPVSKKVHTTRCNAQGIVTKDDTQLIILDTPGLTTSVKAKRHNLENSMLHDPLKSLKRADLVLVLVDVSDRYTRHRLHPQVLKCLASFPQVPSILVLNKVDLLKKKALLLELVMRLTQGVVGGKVLNVRSVLGPGPSVPTAGEPSRGTKDLAASESLKAGPGDLQTPCGQRVDAEAGSAVEEAGLDPVEKSMTTQRRKAKTGWPCFEEIFMVAAVSREEVEGLQRCLLKRAKPGPWEFHSEVLTSQSPQEVCDNIIREKLLEYLPEEVPYMVGQRTEVWAEGPCGELVILQKLVVQKDTHMKMLIGYHGQLISRIVQEAGQDLMNAFLCDVHLKLCVQLEK